MSPLAGINIQVRARCDTCNARFEVSVPPVGYDPPLICCPWCHIVAPLVLEPADEHWWGWVTKQAGFTEIQKTFAALHLPLAPPADKPSFRSSSPAPKPNLPKVAPPNVEKEPVVEIFDIAGENG